MEDFNLINFTKLLNDYLFLLINLENDNLIFNEKINLLIKNKNNTNKLFDNIDKFNKSLLKEIKQNYLRIFENIFNRLSSSTSVNFKIKILINFIDGSETVDLNKINDFFLKKIGEYVVICKNENNAINNKKITDGVDKMLTKNSNGNKNLVNIINNFKNYSDKIKKSLSKQFLKLINKDKLEDIINILIKFIEKLKDNIAHNTSTDIIFLLVNSSIYLIKCSILAKLYSMMEYTVSNYKNNKKLNNLHIKINSKLISRIDKNESLFDTQYEHEVIFLRRPLNNKEFLENISTPEIDSTIHKINDHELSFIDKYIIDKKIKKKLNEELNKDNVILSSFNSISDINTLIYIKQQFNKNKNIPYILPFPNAICKNNNNKNDDDCDNPNLIKVNLDLLYLIKKLKNENNIDKEEICKYIALIFIKKILNSVTLKNTQNNDEDITKILNKKITPTLEKYKLYIFCSPEEYNFFMRNISRNNFNELNHLGGICFPFFFKIKNERIEYNINYKKKIEYNTILRDLKYDGNIRYIDYIIKNIIGSEKDKISLSLCPLSNDYSYRIIKLINKLNKQKYNNTINKILGNHGDIPIDGSPYTLSKIIVDYSNNHDTIINAIPGYNDIK